LDYRPRPNDKVALLVGGCVLFVSRLARKSEHRPDNDRRRHVMAKGQEKPKKNNKPKMTVAEKKAKKKEKAKK
jgi:hypothetical protein